MGMFDNLRCRYRLPVDGLEGRVFQTKDTPEQYISEYEITDTGALILVRDYEGNAVHRHERLTGEIRFYDAWD